MSMYSNGVGI